MSADLATALERQRERLRERAERRDALDAAQVDDAWMVDSRAVQAKGDALTASMLACVEALAGYVDHHDQCPKRHDDKYLCRCDGPENEALVAAFVAASEGS